MITSVIIWLESVYRKHVSVLECQKMVFDVHTFPFFDYVWMDLQLEDDRRSAE
jgi:hypothetical protein